MQRWPSSHAPSGCVTLSLLASHFSLPRWLHRGQSCVCRSFGDFKPLSERVKASGIKLVCQVQTIEQAAAVVPLGADAVVAQVPQLPRQLKLHAY